MTMELDKAIDAVRRSRDAMDASTFSGRNRTADLQKEVDRLREVPGITTRVIHEHGYAVLSRVTGPHLSGPIIEVVSLWHKGERGNGHHDPEYASRVNLRQLRALNSTPNREFAIAVVAMPPEEAWSE